jgi:hypothetical protein
MAWPFVLVVVYPLALPGPAGLVIAGLAGELSLFRCRYQVPGGADPYEITVTPLADGDGAVVNHRPAPDPHGAAPVR